MLTPTPDWRTAPPWACYAAQDPNGGWWWYECLPTPGPSGHWHTGELGTRLERCTGVQPDWRDTLTVRPTE